MEAQNGADERPRSPIAWEDNCDENRKENAKKDAGGQASAVLFLVFLIIVVNNDGIVFCSCA